MMNYWAAAADADPLVLWPKFVADAPNARVMRVFQHAGQSYQSASAWREAECAFWAKTCPNPFDDSCSLPRNASESSPTSARD